MDKLISREKAWEVLKKYNKELFHLKHAVTLEGVMRYLAEQLGYSEEAEYWSMVGLLHDLDFEMFPTMHCVKIFDIMDEEGIDKKLAVSAASHGWPVCGETEPQHEMEKVLSAVDELTGLIGAVALMRPSKSVQDLELKSVMKKFKTPAFAAGCSREIISNAADRLGWSLDKLIEATIMAMRSCEDEVNQVS